MNKIFLFSIGTVAILTFFTMNFSIPFSMAFPQNSNQDIMMEHWTMMMKQMNQTGMMGMEPMMMKQMNQTGMMGMEPMMKGQGMMMHCMMMEPMMRGPMMMGNQTVMAMMHCMIMNPELIGMGPPMMMDQSPMMKQMNQTGMMGRQ
jgi:hypothetical protein